MTDNTVIETEAVIEFLLHKVDELEQRVKRLEIRAKAVSLRLIATSRFSRR